MRCGERSQTNHFTSHNPVGHVILLNLSIASCPVHKSVNGDERCDSSGNYGRIGIRSQEISHYSFQNHGESVDVYWKVWYRYHTRHYPSHIIGDIGDHWISMLMVTREANIGIRTSTLIHITMLNYTVSTQCSLKILSPGVCEEKTLKTVIKAVSYI